jgi:DNA polymerase-3 subunit alpha
MHTYEAIITGQGNMKKSMLSGQLSLLDVMPEEEQVSADMYSDDLPDIPEFSLPTLLLGEKDMLGIYVSGHPVLEYEEEFKKYTTVTSVDFAVQEDDSGEEAMSVQDGASVTAGGIVSGRVVKYTKKNEAMAFVTMEDLFGELELIVFPNLYEKHSQQLVVGTAIVATGRVSVKEGEAAKLVCNSLKILQKNEKTANLGELWLKLPKDSETPYGEIMEILLKHRGNVPVTMYDERTGERKRVSENYWINAGDERLMVGLRSILGDKSVVLRA